MATFDAIFLGGGPAGYVGAIRAAQLGLNVGVIEREGLGGTCVLWGCIPAKALLEASSIANRVKHAAEFGVMVGEVKTDFGVAMKRSRDVSSKNSKGVEFLFKKNKITWIKGTGTLGSGKTVKVTGADGKVTNWNLELTSPNSIRRAGWGPNDLKPGDKVVFEGFGGKVVESRGSLQSITKVGETKPLFVGGGPDAK